MVEMGYIVTTYMHHQARTRYTIGKNRN